MPAFAGMTGKGFDSDIPLLILPALQPADKGRLAATGKGQGVNLDVQKIAVGGPLRRDRQGFVQGEGVAVVETAGQIFAIDKGPAKQAEQARRPDQNHNRPDDLVYQLSPAMVSEISHRRLASWSLRASAVGVAGLHS